MSSQAEVELEPGKTYNIVNTKKRKRYVPDDDDDDDDEQPSSKKPRNEDEENFKPPAGFLPQLVDEQAETLVDASGVLSDDDIELWLFKFPKSFELSAMDGARMRLDLEHSAEVAMHDSAISTAFSVGERTFVAHSAARHEHQSLGTVFPDRRAGWRWGKPVSRQISVVERRQQAPTR